jgi:hypothetical protein
MVISQKQKQVDFFGFLWISLISMDFYGFLWISMDFSDFFGFLRKKHNWDFTWDFTYLMVDSTSVCVRSLVETWAPS